MTMLINPEDMAVSEWAVHPDEMPPSPSVGSVWSVEGRPMGTVIGSSILAEGEDFVVPAVILIGADNLPLCLPAVGGSTLGEDVSLRHSRWRCARDVWWAHFRGWIGKCIGKSYSNSRVSYSFSNSAWGWPVSMVTPRVTEALQEVDDALEGLRAAVEADLPAFMADIPEDSGD